MEIKQNINLALYSSFHTGGPAEFFIEVKNSDEAQEALQFAHDKKLPVLFFGGGTNVLFPDEGIKGLVIRNAINFIENIDNTHLSVGAGVYTTTLAQHCLKLGLSGIEALFGLPGTIGGAIRGNAGTLGTEIKDVIVDVTMINGKNEIAVYPASYFEFAYRESKLMKHPAFITHCTIALKPGNPIEIEQKMIETKKCQKVFKSRWGYHPVSKEYYLKLKKINIVYFNSLRLAAANNRNNAKLPHNRKFLVLKTPNELFFKLKNGKWINNGLGERVLEFYRTSRKPKDMEDIVFSEEFTEEKKDSLFKEV